MFMQWKSYKSDDLLGVMAEGVPALNTVASSVQALGRGFDVTSDIRLLYCKGAAGSRLVELDEENAQDLRVSADLTIPNVPIDIKCLQGATRRYQTGVMDFHQMAEHFNKTVSLSGNIPLGSFNAMFNLSGCWESDAAATKSLALDGVFLSLYKFRLTKLPLVLRPEVKRAVPPTWEPAALASFIENFGTHIVVAVTVGGRDVIYAKRHHSSPLSTTDIYKYVKDIGDQRFLDSESHSGINARLVKDKGSDSVPSINQDIGPQPSNIPYFTGKEDATVIFRRRGGDDLVQSHKQWAATVHSAPDVINMSFVPVTSLLEGVPGQAHLKRAIDLYLECKSLANLKLVNWIQKEAWKLLVFAILLQASNIFPFFFFWFGPSCGRGESVRAERSECVNVRCWWAREEEASILGIAVVRAAAYNYAQHPGLASNIIKETYEQIARNYYLILELSSKEMLRKDESKSLKLEF